MKIYLFLNYLHFCVQNWADHTSLLFPQEEIYANITGPSMKLIDANVSMDGNYSCRVSNRNMSATETYSVNVGYPPTFKNKVKNIKWRGGKDEVISCEADAKPLAKAKWLFNGKPINNTDPDSLSLAITNIGVYSCELSNIHRSITASVCIIDKRKNTKPNSPLVLTWPYEDEDKLEWPELESSGDVIIIEPEDTITLLCPSNEKHNNTFIKFPKLNEIDIICNHEDVFVINNKSYHLSELYCQETIKPVVIKTGERCSGNINTEWLLVGFKAKVFLDVYKSCYDMINGMPLLTHSMMFKTNHMGPGIEQNWYKSEDFEMGNEAYTCSNVKESCCYAKQQFVNALDVAYGAPQISTYIDHVNSIPIWQPCSSPSRQVTWGQVEQSVRDQLKTEDALIVWSGASHFKKHEFKGLVPRYLWKMILVDESHIATVVYVNDEHPNQNDILCKNTCKDRMITTLPCDDKYTYTCEYKDFLTAFNLTYENIVFRSNKNAKYLNNYMLYDKLTVMDSLLQAH